MELPEPRRDGQCCWCVGERAVTTDRRFCKKCLREFIRELSPKSRDLNRQGTETIGRRMRSSAVLGGCPSTNDPDD